MINVDFNKRTYICPFCGHVQAYNQSYTVDGIGRYKNIMPIPDNYQESTLSIYTYKCNNNACGRICVTSVNNTTGKQFDIIPEVTFRHYPEHIPQQIRSDYEEASTILEKSPKAAATLLRRCLQGMIRDFWGIKKGTLNEEITLLQDKVTTAQWKAIDSLRKLGNIGAHMEKDVNLIIDIDEGEVQKLRHLIELLLEKWYISRNDEESLLVDIEEIAAEKESQRKKTS